MWTRNGNTWHYKTMPMLTVEPFAAAGGGITWRACMGGHPVRQITPGKNSRDVMQRAFEYFDRRIDL